MGGNNMKSNTVTKSPFLHVQHSSYYIIWIPNIIFRPISKLFSNLPYLFLFYLLFCEYFIFQSELHTEKCCNDQGNSKCERANEFLLLLVLHMLSFCSGSFTRRETIKMFIWSSVTHWETPQNKRSYIFTYFLYLFIYKIHTFTYTFTYSKTKRSQRR